MSHSTTEKPHRPDGFPLFPHATKRWAKKVKGRTEYFGPWDDPDGALQEWERVKEALLDGRPRPVKREGAMAVADICDEFLKHRKAKVKAGSLRQRTWDEYKAVCPYIFKAFGKERYADEIEPREFGYLKQIISEGKRPKTIHNLITRINAIIKHSNDNGFTERPILKGSYFEKPSAADIRKDKASQEHGGVLMFEANQIRDVLAIASPQLKPMILLGVNVGMGNEDCGRLEHRHVDLKSGFLDFPRPKTGVKRRAKLWPETVQAIQHAVATRTPTDSPALDGYVFITTRGGTWFKADGKANPISREFRTLLKKTGHYVPGNGFYSLRRTFETIASEANDQAAIDLSMGHEGPEMSSLYRQRVGDDRLEAAAQHVRQWLFGKRVAK